MSIFIIMIVLFLYFIGLFTHWILNSRHTKDTHKLNILEGCEDGYNIRICELCGAKNQYALFYKRMYLMTKPNISDLRDKQGRIKPVDLMGINYG